MSEFVLLHNFTTTALFRRLLSGVVGDAGSRATRLLLEDFDIILFDECHHCDKEHPYASE